MLTYHGNALHTAADVTEDFEKSRSASLNFLLRLSILLFVFLQQATTFSSSSDNQADAKHIDKPFQESFKLRVGKLFC